MPRVLVDGRELDLTNVDKTYWPDGRTKGDLIAYYSGVGEYAVRYLDGRPVVMSRYPDGISGKHFYQKECPESAPEWIETVPVAHDNGTRIVNYVVYRGVETLVWLANLGCIEMHALLARADRLEFPDLAVLDLDPAAGTTFRQVTAVALLVQTLLGEFGLAGFPKTSGATGVHIFIPLEPVYTYREVTQAMEAAARLITNVCDFATTERVVDRRAGKVYIDYLQNTFGKSMAFPYSVRPLPGAPVSTPLDWPELANLEDPSRFNMRTVLERLQNRGDPYAGLFRRRYRLEPLLGLGGVPARAKDM